MKLNRQQFCALIGLNSPNLDNRTRANQLALAFGLQTPAVVGEYHPLDVFANALADALVKRGFARETAARIVREHHETWLLGLTRAEWEPHIVAFNARREKIEPTREIYFAVARSGGESFRAAAGLPDQALQELRQARGPAADMVFINIHDVLLNVVVDAFYKTGLLESMMMFTRPRLHPEFPEWRAEIERYRQQSIDRVKTRERVRRERSRAARQAVVKMQQQRERA